MRIYIKNSYAKASGRGMARGDGERGDGGMGRGGMARGDGSGRWGEGFMFFLNRRKRNLNAQQLILY
ncbi:MAG: hypothetical protein F6K58_29550, partial [Symploca sp. SIO2E9]|nr:hypothetical protein [Symploca sp. SIO2E9]